MAIASPTCIARSVSKSKISTTFSNNLPLQLLLRGRRGISHSKHYLPEIITQRAIESRPVLVRDFIYESLYNREYGYFAQNPVVHSLVEPIDFSKLADKSEYMSQLLQAYSSDSISWLTPVEIFKPWYGAALATHMARNTDPGKKLQVFEIGGGNGTAARTILDHIRNTNKELYARTQYMIIEISPLLAEKAREQLSSAGHTNWTVVNRSILDFQEKIDDDCFVMALEVLDNLPHDKVIEWDGKLWQVSVQKTLNDLREKVFREHFRPISDPLISRCLKYFEERKRVSVTPGMTATGFVSNLIGAALEPAMKLDVFLPTVSMRLLEHLERHFPRHQAILADFHQLPSKVPGLNAPIVQFKRDNVTVDVGIYLVEEGKCDIFFPTDFSMLQRMYKDICRKDSVVYSHGEFMQATADHQKTATRSGYNPLLEDYRNMSVLTTVRH